MANGTTTGTLTLTPTFECVGIRASFTGDDNGDNSVALEWRPAGTPSDPWRPAMAMTADRRATIVGVANPYKNEHRASVFGLAPATSYDVRVTFTDADGITGTNPITGTFTTRSDDFDGVSYNGNTYYVATNGNDTTGTGAIGNPYLTIAKAETVATGVGDTIYIRAGTYTITTPIVISSGGDATHWKTVRNYGTESVTIDNSGNTSVLGGIQVKACYVRVKGIRVNGGKIGIYVGPTSYPEELQIHDVCVEGNDVRDGKTLASTPATYCGIRFGGRTEGFLTTMYGITIQDNYVYVVEPGATSAGSSSGPAIQHFQANGQNVIRRNEIDFLGTLGVHGHDAINAFQTATAYTNTIRDTDVYDNIVQRCTDDGISVDGNGMNVRVWGNTIKRSNVGFSTAPNIVGPTYICRNVVYDPERQWIAFFTGLKVGEDSTGTTYFYHNTLVVNNRVVGTTFPNGSNKNLTASFGYYQAGGDGGGLNIYTKNNIIVNDGPVTINNTEAFPTSDYEVWYNYFTQTTYAYWAKFDGTNYGNSGQTNAQNLTSYQASGEMANGVAVLPTFIDATNKDYHLAVGSSAIDVGVALPGFNDAYSPWPAISTPDIGAYEYNPTGISAPTATTSAATNVGVTTATLNGNVTATGGEDPIVTVYWGDNDALEVAGNWDNSAAPTSPTQPQGVAAFYYNVSGLTGNTLYYFKAKATNSAGTSWGASRSFTTLTGTTVPTCVTSAATAIASTTATLNGSVLDTGNEDPTVTVYWGTSDGGTTPGNWTNNSAPTSPSQPQGAAVFYLDVTGLSEGTLYYFSAKATNSAGTSWGTSRSFTTETTTASISTSAATSVTATTAVLNGSITDTGGDDPVVTIYYGTSDGGTTPANWTSNTLPTLPVQPQGVAAFYYNVSGLSPGTLYYFSARAVNSAGTTWGTTRSFTTLITIPNVGTTSATSIGATSATLNGAVYATGGENPTVTVYYGTTDGGQVAGSWDSNTAPTSPAQPQGVATFYYNAAGLLETTLYYFSAKAANTAGTVWGESRSFTTSAAPGSGWVGVILGVTNPALINGIDGSGANITDLVH